MFLARASQTIGEVSLLGALAEMTGVNLVLSLAGLQLVPACRKGGRSRVEGVSAIP